MGVGGFVGGRILINYVSLFSIVCFFVILFIH